MANLLLLFVSIAFFRASPAEVPAGRSTLITAVIAVVLCNSAVTSSLYGTPTALLLASIEVLLSGVFLYICLAVRQRGARFEQSLAALCGVGAVMTLVAWPWVMAIAANPTQPPLWVLLAQVPLMIWSLMVWSRVLRLAGEYTPFVATALSLAFFFFLTLVLSGVGSNPS